tara:strand:+ start:4687 stop:5832 length:1146 start_codon:yes stop_codon:yes gene_type:complete
MKKKILYWGPFTDDGVATKKAIINSAVSINKYSKKFIAIIINAFGEWDDEEKKKNIEFISLGKNKISSLPKYGYINSRYSYLKIFISSFWKLKRILISEKPDFLIAHLIVSLPLMMFILFKFDTKLVLRISGKPKLNFVRVFFWKLANDKIHQVYCPTLETKKELLNKKIFDPEKLNLLFDPVFEVKDAIKKRKEANFDPRFEKNNIVLVGRLTHQKNFKLFVEAFKGLSENYLKNFKAYIFGDGEERKKLQNLITFYKLDNQVILMGQKANIHKYLYNSKLFILTSLWEDPGFVLVEAGLNNLPIISSNCPSGPEEILTSEIGGYLFENNDAKSLKDKIKIFLDSDLLEIEKKIIHTKKNIRKYSIHNHYRLLEGYLSKQ